MKRGTKIRYDYATVIAKVLDISAIEICEEASLFKDIPDTDSLIFLPANIKKIIYNASEREMEQIIEFLENYYLLDDDGREQIQALINVMIKQQNRKNKENIDELERRVIELKSGKSTLKEHDLIEVE